jgi:hypothetical protein
LWFLFVGLLLMRPRLSPLRALAVLLLPSLFFAAVPPSLAVAQETRPADPPACSCPRFDPHAPKSSRPRFADLARPLGVTDEIAALDAIRIALTQVGDGSTFVWHHAGRISGVVQPTYSFKDASGRVCRHIVVVLSSGPRSGRIEGIACRMDDGNWQLEG